LLPADWREWSPVELKAVLAHELAHIARHDAVWRLVAAFALALHWGQPLMHWLRRQLLLGQEMAADELAAVAMGGKRQYLQALAKLALRQEGGQAINAPVALLPVFSGFLLRRMVMLRAQDGSLRRNWRLLMQGCAIGLVSVVALMATAIRALAEPPDNEGDRSIRVAKATDVKARPVAATDSSAVEATFFKRAPVDIAKMAFGEKGGFLIRLGEILQQPRFAGRAEQGDALLATYWKDMFPKAESLPFSLNDVETIMGDFQLMARYLVPMNEEQIEHPHQVMFGSLCGFVRFKKPVAEVFDWLKRTPGAEVKQHGEVTYVALRLAVMGPAKTCLCCYDDCTLMWAGGEGTLQKRLDRLAAANATLPAWHHGWKEVEGGLLMAVAAQVEYKGPDEPADETDSMTREVFSKTRQFAMRADWQPTEVGHTAFGLRLRFENEADARSIEALVHRYIEMGVKEIRKVDNEPKEDQDRALASAVLDILERAIIETRQTENGWQMDVNLSGAIDIESNL
jgi:hypothetical protein